MKQTQRLPRLLQSLSWMTANMRLTRSGWISAVRFSLSPAEINGHVFIHWGVKLPLYLADWCGLKYSLRSYFPSPSLCATMAGVSCQPHTWDGVPCFIGHFSDNKRFCEGACVWEFIQIWLQTALTNPPKQTLNGPPKKRHDSFSPKIRLKGAVF